MHLITGQALASSDVLTHARKAFPYPVARAVHELQRAHTHKEEYEALLQAAEVLAITFSVTAAAVLQGVDGGQARGTSPLHRPGVASLSDIRNRYGRGLMFGGWTSWLEHLGTLTESHPELMPAFRDALQDRPESRSIVISLNELRVERNRPAHLDKPQTQEEAQLRVARCRPLLEHALSKAELLEDLPWLATVSASYRPKTNTFDVVVDRMMSDHPDFERHRFAWSTPVADDTLYVLSAGRPIALSPFAASAFCSQCLKKEVCYTQRLDKQGTAILKSFDRGHEMRSIDVADEIKNLPRVPPGKKTR